MPPLRLFPIASRFRVAATAALGIALLSSAGTAALASGWSTPQLLSLGLSGYGLVGGMHVLLVDPATSRSDVTRSHLPHR